MVESGLPDGMENGNSNEISVEYVDFFDFPMESLEGDDLDEGDWDANFQCLGPLPSESFLGSTLASQGKTGIATADVGPNPSVSKDNSSERKLLPNVAEDASGASIPLQNDYSDASETRNFQALSPVSVLESSGSCPVEKTLTVGPDCFVPVRARTKRSRSSAINPWLVMMPPISSTPKIRRHLADSAPLFQSDNFESSSPKAMARPIKRKAKKKMKLSQVSRANETEGNSSKRPVATKRCAHCEVTKTPQWREGPMGPKTLCNACGVRYRSGRLFPEYRPAASPTFVPSLHSNSHKKVVEMRNKAMADAEPKILMPPCNAIGVAACADKEPPKSPPPEFIPMSSYLYDCILGSSGQYS